jgi:uncharacterized protein YndB with AHSA1/START domain
MSNRTLVAEPNQHSIVATCTFNAPRDLVFKLMADPALIPEWWGPRSLTTRVDKMEAWSGGSWRYIVEDKKGNNWTFHGIYHTIEPSVRTVSTNEYEDMPDHVSMETAIFEDYRGGTKMTTTTVFQTVEDRDAMMQSDMQDGSDQSMDRFAELLARVQEKVQVGS